MILRCLVSLFYLFFLVGLYAVEVLLEELMRRQILISRSLILFFVFEAVAVGVLTGEVLQQPPGLVEGVEGDSRGKAEASDVRVQVSGQELFDRALFVGLLRLLLVKGWLRLGLLLRLLLPTASPNTGPTSGFRKWYRHFFAKFSFLFYF